MKLLKYIVATLVVLVTLFLLGEDVIPNRIEIDDLELVYVVGLDKTKNNKLETTVLRDKESEPTEKETSGGSPPKEKTSISVYSETFVENKVHLATATQKYITMSHAEYALVGEELAKEDLNIVNDYISHDSEGSLDAKVYIVKNMSARELIEKMSQTDNSVSDVIANNELNIINKNATINTSIIQFTNMFLEENSVGLIPTIELTQNDEGNNENEYSLNVFGSAVVYNGKFIEYLSKDLMKGYSIIHNKVKSLKTTIYQDDDSDTKYKEAIVFILNAFNVDMSFDISTDTLNAINLNVHCLAEYEEVHPYIDITADEITNELEAKINENITLLINNTFAKQKELKLDFIQIDKMIYRKHPYKYMKIKENINEQIMNAQININVKSEINGTFDITNTKAR